MSGSLLFRYIPGVGRVPVVLAGPTGPAGPPGVAANTGATGPTGPTGALTIPSGFTAMNGATIALGTGFTGIASTSLTTSATGYVFGQAAVQFTNPDSVNHWVEAYLVVNGSTGNTTNENLEKRTGGTNGYANFSLLHRSGVVGPGTYATTLYARVRDVSSTASVLIDHYDMVSLGHLS